MISLNGSTMIYRPAKQVFDFMSTPENDSKWQYGTLATARLSENVNNVGTSFRSIGHLMGRRTLSTYEVTDYEPGRRYRFKSLSGPLYSQTTYTLKMADGHTRLNISIRANVVNFFQMNERILGRRMKKQLKENLAMLKDLLEVMPLSRVN